MMTPRTENTTFQTRVIFTLKSLGLKLQNSHQSLRTGLENLDLKLNAVYRLITKSSERVSELELKINYKTKEIQRLEARLLAAEQHISQMLNLDSLITNKNRSSNTENLIESSEVYEEDKTLIIHHDRTD